jgi:hypothetical protein
MFYLIFSSFISKQDHKKSRFDVSIPVKDIIGKFYGRIEEIETLPP